MEIGIVEKEFQAIDNSPYERWINDGYLDDEHPHYIMQRLIKIKDGEDNNTIYTSGVIADTIDELRNPCIVDDITNGLYYYQKLLIPTVEHTTSANERVYYEDGSVVYVNSDSGITQTFENPLSDDSFDDIYEIIRKDSIDNCFFFDDYSFSIYSLVECYVMTERDRINNYLKNNCSGDCEGSQDLMIKADILLAAINVINHLIEIGDYFEAQRILNGLNTCGELCKKYTKTLSGCGCGRS